MSAMRLSGQVVQVGIIDDCDLPRTDHLPMMERTRGLVLRLADKSLVTVIGLSVTSVREAAQCFDEVCELTLEHKP